MVRGLFAAEATFAQPATEVGFGRRWNEGAAITKGQTVANLTGNVCEISGRNASHLSISCSLSGIATHRRSAFVAAKVQR